MRIDLAQLHLLAEGRGELAGVRVRPREVCPVLVLRRGPGDAIGARPQICVVLRDLGRQLLHLGHALLRLLVLRNLDGGVLALVAAVAYDFGHSAHEAHGEALFAIARLQASRTRALGSAALEDGLGARPSLGLANVYAGSVEEGGGGRFLLLLGSAVGRGLEEGAQVVAIGGPGLGLVGLGELIGFLKDLGLPAALGEQFARGLRRVHHGAVLCGPACRPERGWDCGGRGWV